MNPLHSMDSPEWYTPTDIVEAARKTMGSIDLDPASHPEANRIVKADRFYTAEDNGLVLPWEDNIFINPPGGLVMEFWGKLMDEYQRGSVEQFVWVGYSLEQLQTLQSYVGGLHPFHFLCCVPNRRIAFIENEAKKAERIARLVAKGKKPNEKSSPTHANYICYGGLNDERFSDIFETLGVLTRQPE